MEKRDAQTGSQDAHRMQGSETETRIKPYYRVHGGNLESSDTQQTMEASLASAHAMLEWERKISVEPMLSVLIPTHNAERWLPALMDRLLSLQAEKEIVIVDDGIASPGASKTVSSFP